MSKMSIGNKFWFYSFLFFYLILFPSFAIFLIVTGKIISGILMSIMFIFWWSIRIIAYKKRWGIYGKHQKTQKEVC